jgi:putative glycerol-1-phosphate prenyltransferase
MESTVYNQINNKAGSAAQFAVLLDPDNITTEQLPEFVQYCEQAQVDLLFVGGSLLVDDVLPEFLKTLKQATNLPVVLFPGSPLQVDEQADALLFLSLISGRNPELLIGQHVIAAPQIKQKNIEVLGTGYLLIEGGSPTTASYMSNSTPIPADKPDIAVSTALAGEMLGLSLIYLDAGSGATQPVSGRMISEVNRQIEVPLIVGGGIDSPEKAIENCKAGADIQVVGNAIEKDWALIHGIAEAIHSVEVKA